MRIVAKSRLLKRAEELGGDVPSQALAWYQEVKEAVWEKPQDVKKHFPKADLVGDAAIVFNLCWNRNRLVVRINYRTQVVWVKFLDTHAEYNKLNVKELRDARL